MESVIRLDEDGTITLSSTNKIELKSSFIDIDAKNTLTIHGENTTIRSD
jgi:hypothetical protein